LNVNEFRNAGHDTYGYANTFGAAAAAGSIAGLDAGKVRYLLSYAAQQASGVPDYPRDTQHIEKAFNFAGRAARNGVTAATMVAMGMTGIEDVFSGDKNFFTPFQPYANPDEIVRELGVRFDVMKTSIKKWSVGNPAQAALDSLAELIRVNKVKAADVEKIVVRIERSGANTVNDRSMPDINVQYLFSVMLLDGKLTFAAVHDLPRMRDPQVLEMKKRIELIADEEMTRALPERHSLVEMKLRDGRELRQLTTRVRGTMDNPMSHDEVDAKAYDLCGPVLGQQRARALLDAVWRIEKVANVRTLRPLLQA
jgi:2-methylcitrate dehydratase PrpD